MATQRSSGRGRTRRYRRICDERQPPTRSPVTSPCLQLCQNLAVPRLLVASPTALLSPLALTRLSPNPYQGGEQGPEDRRGLGTTEEAAEATVEVEPPTDPDPNRDTIASPGPNLNLNHNLGFEVEFEAAEAAAKVQRARRLREIHGDPEEFRERSHSALPAYLRVASIVEANEIDKEAAEAEVQADFARVRAEVYTDYTRYLTLGIGRSVLNLPSAALDAAPHGPGPDLSPVPNRNPSPNLRPWQRGLAGCGSFTATQRSIGSDRSPRCHHIYVYGSSPNPATTSTYTGPHPNPNLNLNPLTPATSGYLSLAPATCHIRLPDPCPEPYPNPTPTAFTDDECDAWMLRTKGLPSESYTFLSFQPSLVVHHTEIPISKRCFTYLSPMLNIIANYKYMTLATATAIAPSYWNLST